MAGIFPGLSVSDSRLSDKLVAPLQVVFFTDLRNAKGMIDKPDASLQEWPGNSASKHLLQARSLRKPATAWQQPETPSAEACQRMTTAPVRSLASASELVQVRFQLP